MVDHVLSTLMPVHRYRCMSMSCNWEGNLRNKRRALRDGRANRSDGRVPYL